MKKILAAVMATVFTSMTLLTGCSGTTESENNESTSAETVSENTISEDLTESDSNGDESDILVAYFSNTGNTECVADTIGEVTGGDVYKIEAAIPYTDEDLNYSNDDCRANTEQNDPSARPEIAGNIENIDEYDTVFIGYPIWWGDAPKIICTFMESYDFAGKTVIPFCTSGGSGISTSENTLKSLAEANWLEGRRFDSGVSEADIEAWLAEIGLK